MFEESQFVCVLCESALIMSWRVPGGDVHWKLSKHSIEFELVTTLNERFL